MEKNRVTFWRGNRATYNNLKLEGKLSYWTRYSVLELDGSWSEYYGKYLLSTQAGELLSVVDALDADPTTAEVIANYNTYKSLRYLIKEEDGLYKVVVYNQDGSEKDDETMLFVGNKYSVRIIKEDMKAFVLIKENGSYILKTYDDVDCGSWD